MPELPEVETVMRGLEPVIVGQVIDDIFCGEKGLRIPFPEGLENRLKGTKVQTLKRRAKYILCYLDNHSILAIHLGMSGRIRILRPGANDIPEKHDHFKLTLNTGHQIILNDARRFGMVFDLPANDLDHHKSFEHLGPEPLSDDFHANYLQDCLRNKSVAIKTAIMDQRLVVGVGNIYACEALFRSGISPKLAAKKLTKKRAEALVRYIKEVLKEAISAGGSTLKDHRLPDGNFGYFQQKLFVYGREDQVCLEPECGAKIKRITQGGRSTFYCPSCQKL